MSKAKQRTLPERYQPGFMRELDRRTEISQRLHATYDAIVSDAGGADGLAHTKLALIERFVFLEAVLQTWERQIAINPDRCAELVGRWVQGVNSLQGLAKMIGLERRQKAVSLRTYVEERQA